MPKKNFIAKNLRTKKKILNKNDRIFTYRSNNKYYNVSAPDVNRYLKQFGNFSAKNFRTWTANVDLIKELKQTSIMRFKPIMMLTIESQQDKRDEAKQAGATGWLVKPVQPDELSNVVRKLLPL